MTTPPPDLGVSMDARASFVALLLAVDRLNEAGKRTPCQGSPASWSADAALSDRRQAAQACQFCPVLEECGAYADAAAEPWHVWAGRDRSLRPSNRKTDAA